MPRALGGGRVCPLTVRPSPRRAAALPRQGSQAARAITDNAAHEVPPCRPRRAGRREPAPRRRGDAAPASRGAEGGTGLPPLLPRAPPLLRPPRPGGPPRRAPLAPPPPAPARP